MTREELEHAIRAACDVSARPSTGYCVEGHDLAASKLVAFREKDRAFVRTLLAEGMVDPETLIQRVHSLPVDGDRKEKLARSVRGGDEIAREDGTMMRRRVGGVLVAALVALGGCGPADVDEGGSSSTDGAVCLKGGPFVARGGIEVGAGGPSASSGAAASGGIADRVDALRWHRYDGCERFVIDLVDGAGDAAAAAGAVSAEVLRDLGVVRVTLRDVAGAQPEATDATFAGPLARAAYAVASPEGQWVYVDLHLGDAAEAAVSALRDPARVVVDLRPGGGRVPPPAPSETRVVVLTPRPGPATYPLTVTGYARTFESNVVVRLEREGQAVHEDFTTATAWADAWGHYAFTIPDGPAARVVLHVGEHSARDGTWEGVAVPLDMR